MARGTNTVLISTPSLLLSSPRSKTRSARCHCKGPAAGYDSRRPALASSTCCSDTHIPRERLQTLPFRQLTCGKAVEGESPAKYYHEMLAGTAQPTTSYTANLDILDAQETPKLPRSHRAHITPETSAVFAASPASPAPGWHPAPAGACRLRNLRSAPNWGLRLGGWSRLSSSDRFKVASSFIVEDSGGCSKRICHKGSSSSSSTHRIVVVVVVRFQVVYSSLADYTRRQGCW